MGQNSGADAVSGITLTAANIQKTLTDLGLPYITQAGSQMLSDLGDPGTEPASVRRQFTKARGEMDAGFAAAQARSKAEIEQEIKQAGGFDADAATMEVVGKASRTIGRSQDQARSALTFQEASSGLNQTNFLLNALSRTGGQLAQGSMQFGNNAIQSGQIQSAMDRQNSQMYSTYGGYVGTVLGGALGLYFSNPALGAGLGNAAGQAVGGWIGSG